MNKKFLSCCLSAVIVAGCSKKEEVVTPVSTNSLPSAKADVILPNVDQITTNVHDAASSAVAATGKAASNALESVTNATGNALASASNVVDSAKSKFASTTNSAVIPTNALSTNATGGFLNKVEAFVKPASTNIVAPTTAATAVTTAQGGGASSLTGATSLASLASLSTDQVTQGLKDALGKGLQQAVASLGQPGGFSTNASVKIPLPDKLQTVEKTLRTLGQGQLADQCITTMNQAAEQAVPVAADVFASSLKNMSVDDAKAIVSGPSDAATQYFRKNTQADLTAKFTPIVQQAMSKTGATAAYEQVLDKAKAASPFFSSPSLDLNAYVTGKTLDGLFKMVADEEKSIRANPAARTTDALKSVFGALQK